LLTFRFSDSAFQLINKLQRLAANVVGQAQVKDAINAARFNVPRTFRFAIKHLLPLL
jgi:hypothetical protein